MILRLPNCPVSPAGIFIREEFPKESGHALYGFEEISGLIPCYFHGAAHASEGDALICSCFWRGINANHRLTSHTEEAASHCNSSSDLLFFKGRLRTTQTVSLALVDESLRPNDHTWLSSFVTYRNLSRSKKMALLPCNVFSDANCQPARVSVRQSSYNFLGMSYTRNFQLHWKCLTRSWRWVLRGAALRGRGGPLILNANTL